MVLEREILVTEFDKPVQRGCGIVAIHNSGDSISKRLDAGLLAVEGVWHRGQQGLGTALQTQEGIKNHVKRGTMEELFPDFRSEFNGSLTGETPWGLFHCIYGTSGGYNSENLQPIVVNTPNGQIAVVHNGQFVGELVDNGSGELREGVSDTYLFTQMLAKEEGNSWEERILRALEKAKGAYALAIGVKDKIFLARDEFGIRPLVIGKMGDGWIAASETLALDKVGVPPLRTVKAGEIIRIDGNGLDVIREGNGPENFCDFEDAYFSRPDSLRPPYENGSDSDHPENWKSFLAFRQKCGEILATERPIKGADFVVGIPDSGIDFATGYANALGIPYIPAIKRDHYNADDIKRVFMEYGRHDIKRRATKKLSIVPDPYLWKDKVVVVCDDSIIRGTVSEAIIKQLFRLGVKEVHWMLGFPKVMFGCHLGVDMRTREELIAARNDGDEIRIAQEIGATSINYISNEGFNRAKKLSGNINIPNDPKEIFLANGGCGGCVTGLYPISREGVIYQASFQGKRQAPAV